MMRPLLRRLAYPLIAAATLLYLWHALRPGTPPDARHGLFMAGLIVVMVVLEACWPLQARWRMSWRTLLRRDLPYMALGGATLATGNLLAGWVVLHHGLQAPTRWLAEVPVVPAALLTLLVSDGLWYAVHRLSHEGRGPVGRWLWRMHAAHHLPQQVYVLMHGVAHPINTAIVRLLFTVPPWLLGVSPEALYVANVITGVQGLVSHFNLDSRAGWLDHLLVGTELHRWHHAVGAMGNYGGVLSVWDQLFGTFIRRPGEWPQRLGVEQPEAMPMDTEIGRVLLEPFVRSAGAHPHTG